MTRAVIAAAVVAAAVVAGVGGASGAASQDATVEVVARYPADDGEMVGETVVEPGDVASVEAPQTAPQSGGWQVPMELTDEAAERFAETLTDAGFTSDGVQSCPASGERNDDGYCLLTVVDGEVETAFAVGPSFADVVESGEFADDPRFVLSVVNETAAEEAARAFGWQPEEGTTSGATADEGTTSEQGADEGPETTDAAVTTAGTEPAESDESGGGAPGPGVVGAVVAVAAAAAVARRG